MTRHNARYFAKELYWLVTRHAIDTASYGTIIANGDGWIAILGCWLVEMKDNGAITRITKEM